MAALPSLNATLESLSVLDSPAVQDPVQSDH